MPQNGHMPVLLQFECLDNSTFTSNWKIINDIEMQQTHDTYTRSNFRFFRRNNSGLLSLEELMTVLQLRKRL